MGEYQLQAAIAAVHDRAPHADDTDWPQILALYGLLERMTGNPVVTLNRAVAAAMADGPAAGLALLDGIDERMAGHYRLDAVRAHMLEMAGDEDAAVGALSRRGRPHDEPAGTALPVDAGRASHETRAWRQPSGVTGFVDGWNTHPDCPPVRRSSPSVPSQCFWSRRRSLAERLSTGTAGRSSPGFLRQPASTALATTRLRTTCG